MANCGKDILLSREGTEQQQRLIEALDPTSVKLNEFGLEEWMQFAYNFASHVNYFGTENSKTPSGNWEDFFKSDTELDDFIKEVSDGKNITPHIALFVSFVKLLEISKQRFNKINKRHLDFYYKKVLKLEKQPATPDKVHAIFELAKNCVTEKIAKETQLDGGKDTAGNKLIYETNDELVANQAKVSLLKNVYNDHTNQKLKAAATANSYNGKGEDFPDDDIKWWPFGYYETPPTGTAPDTREYPELDDAKIGFALSGEIFELLEGERNVQITMKFNNELSNSVSFNDLYENLEIYCTGEKDWLGTFDVINNSEFSSGSDSADLKILKIAFQISKEEEAVVGYDSKIYSENFDSELPVCRVIIKTENETGHKLFREIVQKTISTLQVDVTVRDVKSLTLSNDIGTINAEKPFYPFGTQPVKKSKFYIDYAELYKKKWDKLSVNIEWKNTPNNFREWYAAYRSSFNAKLSVADYLEGILTQEYLDLIMPDVVVAEAIDTISASTESAMQTIQYINLIVENDNYFTAKIEVNQKEDWNSVSNTEVMFEKQADGLYEMNFDVANPDLGEEDVGPIRLSINEDFKHNMYPRLYALAMSSDDNNVLIPNEPYTPFVEEIKLDYSASAKIDTATDEYDKKDLTLYHEHPFGQSEECLDLKEDYAFFKEGENPVLNLVPTYCKGGELYIGLENAEPKQTVSLLIQALEGSENPEAESFEGKQKAEWWVLCTNEWKELDTTEIISNDIDNFLKSGIFKFTVPKEATDDNTLLPSGYIWLKVRIHKNFDAVSKVIGIHAQAVVAQFADNNNDLSHLEDGLPAKTISKLVNRIPKVKGLSQPYNSFDGKPEESDSDYYRRISERLRHKNRAITVWDYEHLVLQNFPEIYKVKCLNHTCTNISGGTRTTKYLSPGSVMLVVIPDIVNKNVFDIYQPRVSKATLNKIQKFLQKLNSLLLRVSVINPEYEEVRVELKVKFYKGFDEAYYKTVLDQDLTKLLSPWAFDNTAAIQFGISLHKSVVIYYVEKLDYVDFVTDVKLFHKKAATSTEIEVNVAIPSSPEAILVSAKAHDVKDAGNDCTNITIEPAEECQT
ncbi:MAG: baseplate J/gp47 family protein [Bacteroidota bacterium]